MDVPVTVADASGRSNPALAKGTALQAAFRRVIRSLAATFLPTRCMGCGILFNPRPVNSSPSRPATVRALADHSVFSVEGNGFDDEVRGVVAPTAAKPLCQWVCSHCIVEWLPVSSPLCSVCGMPFISREGGDHMCGECLRSLKNFRMARAAAVYTPLAMALVHGFKYNGKIQLAGPLGTILAGAFARFWEAEDIDLVLPVPLHRRRFRRRGFNQAYLLATSLVRQLERTGKYASTATVEREAVSRTRPTAPQTGLKRKGRLDNIRNAFQVTNSAVIKDRRILLVDDIYTTGATVNECAKVLLGSGAARIDVLTVARAV